MQALQHQISSLSGKIDALQTIVERISLQLLESTHPKQAQPDELNTSERQSSAPPMHYSYALDNGIGHKDILEDHPYIDNQRTEQSLSPELQIQRLTAQLTAAYNRIAALEEQLLASRVTH
jgi:hypothetical protein